MICRVSAIVTPQLRNQTDSEMTHLVSKQLAATANL
jgi:hypothetical protein